MGLATYEIIGSGGNGAFDMMGKPTMSIRPRSRLL